MHRVSGFADGPSAGGRNAPRRLTASGPARRAFGRRTLLAGFALALATPALIAQPLAAERLTVFAAASAKTALDTLAPAWAGPPLAVSLAGSSALARQIERGAPADVFLSASPDWMDRLDTQGRLAPSTRLDLLGNRLVVVAHGADAPPLDLADLPQRLGNGRLAMALVDAVPAGIYGQAALRHLGLWDSVAPAIAQTDNVRAALALVARGAAPFGIVYASDARAEPRVTPVATFPAESHPPIVYPVAAIAGGAVPDAVDFIAFLQGPEARAAFTAQGFAVLTP